MAIEFLSDDFKVHPNLKFFLVGFIYFSVAVFISIYTFYQYAGIVSVILCVFAAFPYFYKKIKSEEEYDERVVSEKKKLKRHSKFIKLFMVFFLGVVIASAFWYIILPHNSSTQVFAIQSEELFEMGSVATGSVTNLTFFGDILTNNLSVMIACVLFSFVYGSGAIFLLTWNATIVGVAIGMIIKQGLSQGYGFYAVFDGLFRYVIHGVPEILGFIFAGLAGGIISVAVLRGHIFTKKGESVIIDAVDLILIAIGLILLAAALEVWVTPIFFG